MEVVEVPEIGSATQQDQRRQQIIATSGLAIRNVTLWKTSMEWNPPSAALVRRSG